MAKLKREDVPPGTWVIYEGQSTEYLIPGKKYQVSNCKVHEGETGAFINILGTRIPNGDGGWNQMMSDFRLSKPEEEIINEYQIY